MNLKPIYSKDIWDYTDPDGNRVIVGNTELLSTYIDSFCTRFFKDHNLDFNDYRNATYTDWINKHGNDLNDCSRLLPYKTSKYDFAAVVVDQHTGAPVHISFAQFHGPYLRIGIGFNTLPDHRVNIRAPMWNKEYGYLNYFLSLTPTGMFVTFHGRNKKLTALVKLLRQNKNKSGFLGIGETYLSDFKIHSDEIIFNHVPQSIAYRHHTGITTPADYQTLIKIL